MTRDDKRLREKLEQVRAADAEHERQMQKLAEYGPLPLNRIRALRMSSKDAYITSLVKARDNA